MRAFIRAALFASFFAFGLVLFLVLPGFLLSVAEALELDDLQCVILFTVSAVALAGLIFLLMSRFSLRSLRTSLQLWLTECSHSLEESVAAMTPGSLHASIIVTAALSLFLELVLIRWQGSLFPVFALYKNFTLLACFCGLGIGYAMARRKPLLLSASLPILGVILLCLVLLRYAAEKSFLRMLYVVPVQEESSVISNFGIAFEKIGFFRKFLFFLPVYLLLVGAFALNVLTLLPVGQFCGYLMDRAKPLTGYGCNLLGSIMGVGALFILSWFWLGPVIWFGLSALLLLWYQLPSARAQKVGLCAAMLCVFIVAWPAEPLVQSIYSPYQLIQKTTKPDGLMRILASGIYYQKVHDLSLTNANRDTNPALKKVVGYYELPFHTATSLNYVAIVGAGSGNDVAAALRSGAGTIDAVEIDPAILALGQLNHPERPYSDPRVHPIVNDARTFLRNTKQRYDAIIYGLLDSHVLLSHGSNVRVDSFVYTQEGLREAFDHLKAGGLMSVAFSLSTPRMGQKIYRILSTLPGAGRTVVVSTDYDNASTFTFMVNKGADIVLPADFLKQHNLQDVTANYAKDSSIAVDLPTDDWPFFYMDAKMYPASYVVSLALVLVLSLVMIYNFLPGQRWQVSLLSFFFLGVGFMLVETKAITELGLLFGNTWYVIGITIMSVLVMAFLANLLVAKTQSLSWITRSAYLFLLLAVIAGYFVAIHRNLLSGGPMAQISMVFLLTCPLLFSGIVFSTLLNRTTDVAGAMAYNLMGAMLGGLLEYNSMQYGFASLYLIALVFYALAVYFSRFARKVVR